MKIKLLSNSINCVQCDAGGWDTGSHGQFTDNDNILRYKTNLSKEAADLTICHELTHAIESLTGISLTEEQVQAIALGWYSIIKENPKFIGGL
jgi:Zn-dependent peptidase ImmA (M78 family)